MAILRKHKRDRYTVIDNAVFDDANLSIKAKGMLCQMLSLPDDWDFTILGLTRKFRDGKASVMAALNELEDAGYFRRIQIKDGSKFAGIEYVVSETRMSDSPYAENWNSENWNSEKRNQQNTNKQTTNKQTTNKFIVPTIEKVQEYITEKGYSVDAEHFIDYYTANGWRVGKNPMKDWKAAIRNWERMNGTNSGAGGAVRSGVRSANGRSKGDPEQVETGFIPSA